MNTFEAIVREYANAADCSFEQGMYDIFESELGVDIAEQFGYTIAQLGELADAYEYTKEMPWVLMAVYSQHGLMPDEHRDPRICLRFRTEAEATAKAVEWNNEPWADHETWYVVAKEVTR